MERRIPPTPAGVEMLRAVVRLLDNGQPVTHGVLCGELGRRGRAVSETLFRLENEGWISRPPYRAGCKRLITLAPRRSVVAKALGLDGRSKAARTKK
jgi:hypothetical protein